MSFAVYAVSVTRPPEEKNACKSGGFAASLKCIRKRGRRGPARARLAAAARRTASRSSGSSIAALSEPAARARPRAVGERAGSRRRARRLPGDGTGPGAKRSAGRGRVAELGARASRGSRPRSSPSSNAQVDETRRRRAACRRAPIRCGHAARAIAARRPSGHAASPRRAPRRPGRPRRGSAPAHRSVRAAPSARPTTAPGVTTRSCAGASGSASAPVAVTIVWPTLADSLAEDRGGGRVELREGVVEQEERRHAAWSGEHLGLGEEERQHGDALLALRAERAEVAVAGEDRISSRCGPEPGRAALEVARQPLVERRDGRRLRVVAERRALEAELARALGEARRAGARASCRARLDELVPRAPRPGRRPGRERRGVGDARPRPGAARRCAARARRRTRAGPRPRAGRAARARGRGTPGAPPGRP